VKRFEQEERDRLQGILDECREYGDLTNWEYDFVESVCDQFESGRNLSGRQVEILEKIYEEKVC